MKARLTALAFFVAAVSATPALADFRNGNSLLADCLQKGDHAFCLGYIEAIADILGAIKSACFDTTVSGGQLAEIVLLRLNDNPEKRHYAAHILVSSALIAAFPCRK